MTHTHIFILVLFCKVDYIKLKHKGCSIFCGIVPNFDKVMGYPDENCV